MAIISNKEVVILGMLYEQPMHGYEIEKQITETSMRDWTEIGFSSIYYILKKLKSKKLIKSELTLNEKNQTRKIYHITNQGKVEVKNSLKSILSDHENTIWRIDLGIAYLNILDEKDIIECLYEYKKTIRTKLNCFDELLDYLKSIECSENRYELAYRPKYLLKAEVEWVDNFISKMKSKD